MEAIRSLFVPIESGNLLIPNAAIAEIIQYIEPTPAESSAPDWYLGNFDWREQRVPLVSFEAASGHHLPSPTTTARVAILKAVKDSRIMPYIAIITRQIPRLVTVYEESIEPLGEGVESSQVELSHVLANGEPAVIPDLDALESLVMKQY